jgi:hypothetical protein
MERNCDFCWVALTLQLGAVTQESGVEQVAVEGIQSVQCSDHLCLYQCNTCAINNEEVLMWEGYRTLIPLPTKV